jgi:hypothetical protein
VTELRRRGLLLATSIAVLAVAIAALPLIQGAGGPGDLGGPAIVPRPLVIAVLLGVPAGVAAIAALRASRPLFIAAGMLCLLQSVVAFSGATLIFVIPGILLLGLGLGRTPMPSSRPTLRREWLAGVFVLGLGIAAWIVPFATSETVCWIARAGPDGSPVYTRIPDTGMLTLGPGDMGSGCDGGAFTLDGLVVGGILGIGALAMAGLAAGQRRWPA